MDHVGRVRGLEPLGDLLCDIDRLVLRDRAAVDPLGEVEPFDELHREKVGVLGVMQPVHRRDIRVVERTEQLGLAFEPREALRVARHDRR